MKKQTALKINRRLFLRTTTTLSILGGLNALQSCKRSTNKRPNVIFIITDDQDRSDFNFLPEGQDKDGRGLNLTPNIDRLHREGVHFTHTFCASTVCTPSRYNCLTGQYASRANNEQFLRFTRTNHGQTSVQWNTHIHQGTPNLAKILKANGYFTGAVGKNHVIQTPALTDVAADADLRDPKVQNILSRNQNLLVQAYKKNGFDFAASIYNGNTEQMDPEELRVHNLDWIFKGGLDFIQEATNKNQPFFLYLATTVKHGSRNPAKNYKADPRMTPAGLLDQPLDIMPPRNSIEERIKNAGLTLGPQGDKGNLTWLDDGIGVFLNELEKDNVLKDTIIFYFNDQGMERGGKGTLYQGGVRSVGLVRGDGFSRGEKTQYIQNIDFAPTILELCHVPETKWQHMDGKSFVSLLKGDDQPVHDSLYFEMGDARAVIKDGFKYYTVRHTDRINKMSIKERKALLDKRIARAHRLGNTWRIKDPTLPFDHLGLFPGGNRSGWKAMDIYPHYFDEEQLYDLNADPVEQHNLAYNPKYKEKLGELRTALVSCLDTLPGSFQGIKT